MRLAVGLLIVVCAGACASAPAVTFADRFVRPGTPAVDLGGPRPVGSRAVPKLAHPGGGGASEFASRVSSTTASLEAANPELGDAVLRVRLAPTTDHYLAVARIYHRLGVLDTAYDYLDRSLAVNGPDPAVHDQLARVWRDWGQPGTGLAHAYQAVHLAPDWPVAENTLGTLLFAMGRRTDARERFERAVSLDPGAAYALANLCIAYQAEGRTRDAIRTCRRANDARRRPRNRSKQEPD